MGNRNRNRNRNKNVNQPAHTDVQKQESPMQTEITNEPAINPEATQTLPQDAQSSEAPANPEAKKEEKQGTMLDVAMAPFKFAWEKVLVPTYEFVKGIVLKGWQKIVDAYNHEVDLFKQLGITKYLMDRVSKAALGILKLAGAVTIAYVISVLAQTYLGINIFSGTSLLVAGGLFLILVIGKSYLTQKASGKEFSIGATGAHIMEAVAA